jgi:hypothetical protein
MGQAESRPPQEPAAFPAWFHPLQRDKMTREALEQRGVPTISRWLGWYALRRDWDAALNIPLPEQQPAVVIQLPLEQIPAQELTSTLQQGEQLHG